MENKKWRANILDELKEKLTGDKMADTVILTKEIMNNKELSEVVSEQGLNEIINHLTVRSKENDIQTSIRILIESGII